MEDVYIHQYKSNHPMGFVVGEYESTFDQAKERSNENLVKLVKSSVWSDRYNGYEIVINALKKDDLGISSIKELNIDISKFLDEPNSLASRRAYKAVSIYVKIERNIESLKKSFYSIIKQCLTGGVANRFTYRYAVRIICQLFEKLSNVDELNRTILSILIEYSKNVKTIQGLLKLLNLFVCKYGPEKIDIQMFTEQISEYSSHPVDKIRDESLKFFVFVAKWNDNSDSILRLAEKSLKTPQIKRLEKMMECFKTVEEISYDDILEDSDGDTWYNKEGDQIVRFEGANSDENTIPIEPMKYGAIFVGNLKTTYKWVVKVSKIDEIIFDLVWNRIKKSELPYLTDALSSLLMSYNLNVLIKTMKLFSLLILKFKEDFTKYALQLKEHLVISMATQKAAFMIEVSKVFFYLSKYCVKPDEYIQFICECINISKGISACKVLVEILIAYLHNNRPEFESIRYSKGFISCMESISNKTPICLNHFTGIILLELQETYPNDYDKLLSPILSSYKKEMNEGKIKRLNLAKASMISKYSIGIESIQSDYMQKDLELLDEGYESFEQLSEETSSQCSSDFDFIEKEDIPDDIFLDLGTEEVPKETKDDKNCVIF